MINDKNLKQEGGEKSTNLQGQVVTIYNGLTYADVKEIAVDVFNSNFIILKKEAAEIAQKRAEEITENLLTRIKDKTPEALDEFQQPAMQDALFNAQKDYAKSGDKDLGDLLVDMLIDRANASKRTMLQIVLDESLKIASKLTVEHLDTLTLNFLTTRTRRLTIRSLAEFDDYMNRDIAPFIDGLVEDYEQLKYLEYLGLVSIRLGNWGDLENNWGKTYQAIFSKGFTKEKFETDVGKLDDYSWLLIKCFHNPLNIQFNTMDLETLNTLLDENKICEETSNKLRTLFEDTTMKGKEIQEYLKRINSKLEKLFKVWSETSFKNLEMTSVGVAIAHANYRRRTGQTMDLSIWIK
jgi:hypothetical protein